MSPESSQVDWGPRGGRVLGVELSFYPKATAEAWSALFERLKLTSANRALYGAARKTFRVLALPAELSGYYLDGVVHPLKDDPDTAHWSLEFKPVPHKPPPDDIQVMSAALGGLEGFLRDLADGWPAQARMKVEIVSAGFALDSAKWAGVRGFAESIALNVAPPLRLDMLGWQVEPPSGPIEHVNQVRPRDPDMEAVVLTASGNATLTIGPTLLQEAEEALWQGLRPLLVVTG